MQRLFIHIERLLMTNDCVIIPEFGGFVLHPCPAAYQPEKHRFCPPGKGIVFNPTLKHYDRLIPESYIQMYGMSFEDAHITFRKDIEDLSHILDKERSVCFDKIGVLRKDDDGKLVFEAEQNSSFVALKPYCLYPFHLPPVAKDVQKLQTETSQTIKLETKHKRVVYLPMRHTLLRVIGVSAAAVALFLFVSMPVNDMGSSSHSASLIPSEMVLKGEERKLKIENGELKFEENEGENQLFSYTEKVEEMIQSFDIVTNETKDSTVEKELVTVSQPNIKSIEATSQKIYYAIIGSFTSEKQANLFIQQINMPELSNIGIVINEERVRVYADKFDKRDDAQNYILRLRANEKLKDTWLFIQ